MIFFIDYVIISLDGQCPVGLFPAVTTIQN